MDLAKIQYFLEAARLTNFTQAARNCHIAQTTMTKYITQLEKELGCRLFRREHRGVSLTPEGGISMKAWRRSARNTRTCATHCA